MSKTSQMNLLKIQIMISGPIMLYNANIYSEGHGKSMIMV